MTWMNEQTRMNRARPLLTGTLLAALAVTTATPAQAAVGLDRTRAIFDGSGKSLTLNITNNNEKLPYLAQAWLEDEQGTKVTSGPLVVTPPVQRLEGGAKGMVRVMAPGVSVLPQDRESLFWFNLREIPPKSEKPNVLQIALQTRIKLFYRPEAIKQAPDAVWQDKLVLHAQADGWRIENPTPYYITVIGIGATAKLAEEGQFSTVMVSPKSSVVSKGKTTTTPYLTYINDYGGRPTLRFACTAGRCEAKEEVKRKA